MNREEAIAVLKEIVYICKMVDMKQIALKTVRESASYELHIQNHFNEHDTKCLQDILQKRKLSIRKNNGTVAIYKPKNN